MHAADLLRGTGMVEARDVSERKTDLIEENIMRCGFPNIRTMVRDATFLDPSMIGPGRCCPRGSSVLRARDHRQKAGYQGEDDER